MGRVRCGDRIGEDVRSVENVPPRMGSASGHRRPLSGIGGVCRRTTSPQKGRWERSGQV